MCCGGFGPILHVPIFAKPISEGGMGVGEQASSQALANQQSHWFKHAKEGAHHQQPWLALNKLKLLSYS